MAKIFTYIAALVLTISASVYSTDVLAQSSENRFSINAGEAKMTVYPVPATTYVNIYLSPALRQIADRVEIMSITGSVVMQQRLISTNTSEVSFNNIDNQPAGVYIVATRDKDGKILQSSKLMIKK